MKSTRFFSAIILSLACSGAIHAQNADEIISKYLQAIGGKEVISKIKSIYMESSMKIRGIKATTYTTVLNGKGYKTESSAFGRKNITCYNDKSGWTCNSKDESKAEEMPQNQYKEGRDQIFIGSPFIDYKTKGYKAEYAGSEKVGNINALKIRMTKPNGSVSEYFFDPSTWYLIKSSQKTTTNGREVEITMTFSDYYKTKPGYSLPLNTEMNFNNSMSMNNHINKIIVDQQVNSGIFVMPD